MIPSPNTSSEADSEPFLSIFSLQFCNIAHSTQGEISFLTVKGVLQRQCPLLCRHHCGCAVTEKSKVVNHVESQNSDATMQHHVVAVFD